MGIEKEPKSKEKSAVEASLEFEKFTQQERKQALDELARLKASFEKEIKKQRSEAEKIELIKKRFTKSTDPERIEEFLENNKEDLERIFYLALMGELLWEVEGYQHEDLYILSLYPEAKGTEKITKRAEYLRECGQNNLHNTLIKKVGDCNRLATILMDMAKSQNIPLQVYSAQHHVSTAMKFGDEIVMLDTGEGELFFTEDYKKIDMWKESEFELGGEKRLLLDNLADEFISIIESPHVFSTGKIEPEEVERLRKIGKQLLEMNIEEVRGENFKRIVIEILEKIGSR